MSIKVANDTNNGSATLKSANVPGDVNISMPSFSTELAPRMQLMTAQNSTSGTSIDFTGIPSWAKKITVMFNVVSTSGASYPRVQLGSTTIATTGYSSNSNTMANTSTNLILNSTSGFDMYIGNASSVITGTLQFNLLGINLWVANGIINTLATAQVTVVGAVTLSSTLDRIRITTVNGTDTFDAGQIGVLYEG